MEVFIGDYLRNLKKVYGNEDELSNMLCVSQSTVNKYINNKLSFPFEIIENILKTNKKLGIEIALKWKEAFDQRFIKAVTA